MAKHARRLIRQDLRREDQLCLQHHLLVHPLTEVPLNGPPGVYGSKQLTIPSMYVEQGCFIHLAEAVKQRVSIPVVAVGRIKKPDMAEAILRDKKADMVALGRSPCRSAVAK